MSDERFARIEALFGTDCLARLNAASVAVFGLGGVGGSCVEALARGGIGRLVLVDGDAIEPSNINRQALARESTVGMRKVDAACTFVQDLNPHCRVETHDMFLQADEVAPLLNRIVACDSKSGSGSGMPPAPPSPSDTAARHAPLDFIIDCVDSLDVKVALACWARDAGIPIVSCMGTARKIDPSRFEFTDLFNTQVCPLCRSMRRKARAAGIEALTVLYSQEEPLASVQESTPMSSESVENADRVSRVLGTASYVPPIAGMMLAGYAIRMMCGTGIKRT